MRKFLRRHRVGISLGALFGTIGLYALSLLSLLSPVIETIAIPFMLPSRVMASLFVRGEAASTGMVLLLYLLTAVLYGIAGGILQYGIRLVRYGPVDHKK